MTCIDKVYANFYCLVENNMGFEMNLARTKSRTLVGCASSLTLMAAMFASQQAAAHGYMDSPPSRAYACKLKLNTECGPAEYEPQTVGEGPKGFPTSSDSPADGKIPSGGNNTFSAMNAQSPDRWHLTEIKDRNTEFSWFFTAAHKTTKWEYFITKAGWDSTQPLTRATFDSTPFCSADGGGAVPIDGSIGGTGQIKQKHACEIPEDRSGHHVILGAWTVDDTPAAFYDVVDVNITAEDAYPDGFKSVGVIPLNQKLLPGDSVKARALTGSTDSAEYTFSVNINSVEEGKPENWSHKLAQAVNAAEKPVRAGVRNEAGEIEPIKGANTLFAQPESGVTRYEVQTTMVPDPTFSVMIHDVAPEYTLDNGRGKVSFTVMSNKKITVTATVYEGTKAVGTTKQTLDASNSTVDVAVLGAPGAHKLIVTAITEDGRNSLQKNVDLTLTGEAAKHEFDAVFPEGIKEYKAGTKVLQPKTDKVYECKPFPFSGWCGLYSPSANGYEPGVGSNWADAWIEMQ